MTRTIQRRRWWLGLATLVAAAAWASGPAQAEDKPLHTFEFVVLHETPAALLVAPMGATNVENAPAIYCHTDPGTLVSLPAGGSFVEFKPAALTLKACPRDRARPAASDVISVVQFVAVDAVSCQAAGPGRWDVEVKVEKRQTLLESGLRKIIKFAGETFWESMGANDLKSVKTKRWCAKRDTSVVQHSRATVTVSVRDQTVTDKDAKPAATASVITGPEERWFLAGDGLVDSAKQLKWDSATRTLKSDKAPDQLYLSANYMFGDLYGSYGPRDLRRTTVKFMLLPSRKPFDSVGVGLGFRFADGAFSGGGATPASDGGFMAFAGVFWTRSDGIDAAGNRTDGSRERSVRVGVSYSLDTLIGWLGK